MARRFINTAKFNPYSYQELAAPVQRATAILAQQAQGLNELEMQNAALEKYLDPELDKEAYQTYQQNRSLLENAVNDLSTNGLTANTYNNLRNLNVTYAQTIKPLQLAVNNRIKHISEMSNFLTSHPEVALKGSLTRPINEYINGIPQMELVSGESIKKDVAEVSKLLAAAHRVDMTKEKWSQYKDLVRTQYGYTLPEFEQAKQPGTYENSIVSQILQKHGVIDQNGQNLMNNLDDFNRMLFYASEGMMNLLGKQEADIKDNDLKDIQSNYYQSEHLKLAQRAADRADAELIAKAMQQEAENPVQLYDRQITKPFGIGVAFTDHEPVLVLSGKDGNNWGQIINGIISASGHYGNILDEKGKSIANIDLKDKNIAFSIGYPDGLDPENRKLYIQLEASTKDGSKPKIYYLEPEHLMLPKDQFNEYRESEVARQAVTAPTTMNTTQREKFTQMTQSELQNIKVALSGTIAPITIKQ